MQLNKLLIQATVFLLMSLLFIDKLSAQSNFINVTVIDSITNQPIEGTLITFEKTSSLTKKNGQANIGYMTLPISLKVNRVGYLERTVFVNENSPLIIKLEPKPKLLPEVEVMPNLPKHLFFGEKGSKVLDFVIKDKYIILVTGAYPKDVFKIIVLDVMGQFYDELIIPSNFEFLYKSGLNNIYMVTTNAAFSVEVRKGIIQLTNISKRTFDDKITYYKGAHGSLRYIQYHTRTGQTCRFIYEDVETRYISLFSPFCEVVDPKTEKIAKRELDSIYRTQGRELLKDHLDLDFNGLFVNRYGDESFVKMEHFKQRFINNSIYVPFLQFDSGFYILNFYNDSIYTFNFDCSIRNQNHITFHQEKDWLKKVVLDNNQLYTFYKSPNEQITVAEIETNTFQKSVVHKIYYDDARLYNINNGFVYYLTQPDKNSNEVYLFREKL